MSSQSEPRHPYLNIWRRPPDPPHSRTGPARPWPQCTSAQTGMPMRPRSRQRRSCGYARRGSIRPRLPCRAWCSTRSPPVVVRVRDVERREMRKKRSYGKVVHVGNALGHCDIMSVRNKACGTVDYRACILERVVLICRSAGSPFVMEEERAHGRLRGHDDRCRLGLCISNDAAHVSAVDELGEHSRRCCSPDKCAYSPQD
jgi:hypothetical protein